MLDDEALVVAFFGDEPPPPLDAAGRDPAFRGDPLGSREPPRDAPGRPCFCVLQNGGRSTPGPGCFSLPRNPASCCRRFSATRSRAARFDRAPPSPEARLEGRDPGFPGAPPPPRVPFRLGPLLGGFALVSFIATDAADPPRRSPRNVRGCAPFRTARAPSGFERERARAVERREAARRRGRRGASAGRACERGREDGACAGSSARRASAFQELAVFAKCCFEARRESRTAHAGKNQYNT